MTREEAIEELEQIKEAHKQIGEIEPKFVGLRSFVIRLCETLMQPCKCEALRMERNLLAEQLATILSEEGGEGYFCPKAADKCTCMFLVSPREDEEEPWCDAEQNERAQCWLEWAKHESAERSKSAKEPNNAA